MDEFSTPQFSKTISNANDTHDDYQIRLHPYPSEQPKAQANKTNEWHAVARACHILFSCAITAHLNFV